MDSKFKGSPDSFELRGALLIDGYTKLTVVPGVGLCGLRRFMFTVGLCVLTSDSILHRWCYADMADASEALRSWDGIDDPPGPWIKYKGIYGDRSNTNYEK